MNKEFTKADLKDGMIVELNCGTMALKIGDEIACSTSCFSLDAFKSDLTHLNYNATFDIAKVYRVKSVRTVNDIFQKDFLELIWERKETKYMTVEEMRVKLEELTGEKIEAEPSRNDMIAACYQFCAAQGEGCWDCRFKDSHHSCCFTKISDKELKQCYEKVMKECE